VRCAKCGHMWRQLPPEPEAEPVAVAADAAAPHSDAPNPTAAIPADLRGRAAPERSLADRLGILAGWLALAVMVFVIGWTGFRFREEFATLWPQSSSLFATFGVAVNERGIAIDDWSYHREIENGEPVIVVTGRLVNRSARELTVPPVRVSLTDDGQHELYHWMKSPPQPTLMPGQSLGFSMRLPSPPPGAKHLQLRFASQD